jgi:hypothetical protein
MESTPTDTDELRVLVRRALLGMLQQEEVGDPAASSGEPASPGGVAPDDKTIQITVRGSQRSIGLIEDALRKGETCLQVSLGRAWGPQAQVQVDSFEPTTSRSRG